MGMRTPLAAHESRTDRQVYNKRQLTDDNMINMNYVPRRRTNVSIFVITQDIS